MKLDSLTVSLILGWLSFMRANASPTSKFIVELSACGMDASNVDSLLTNECQSICQAVIEAQRECEREARCTCSKAPPSVLQSCIQCSIDSMPASQGFASAALLPTRISDYAQVCGQSVDQQQLDHLFANMTEIANKVDATPVDEVDSEVVPALSKREMADFRCLFGLPEVVEMRSHWTELSQATGLVGPWPAFLFVVVALLCFAENKRTKVTSKAQQG